MLEAMPDAEALPQICPEPAAAPTSSSAAKGPRRARSLPSGRSQLPSMAPRPSSASALQSRRSLCSPPVRSLSQASSVARSSASVETSKAAATATKASSSGEAEPAAKVVTSELRCKDLKGVWHDVKELRRRRNAAVMKGMRWLHKFLTANKHEGLVEIGDDGACIFFEIWYTSSDSTIRSAAKGIAIDLLERYERHLLKPDKCKCQICFQKKRKELTCQEFFMTLMYLVRCKEEMELDTEAMLNKADELFRVGGFSDTAKLLGVSPDEFGNTSDDDWVVLTMNIMVLEFNQLLFKKRWPLKFGLKEAFTHFRTRQWIGPPYGADYKFHDSFYFATHVVFAISAYSAVKTNPKDVPWLFDYCRRSALYWVKQAWTRFSGKQSNRLVDIDGLAEAVDVMRGCGQTDGGDTMLCSATLVLLELQQKDGSWPYWMLDHTAEDAHNLPCVAPEKPSFYNRCHPTWVVVQSLRDRNFEYDRKGNADWAQYSERLLKQTNLGKLETRVAYGGASRGAAKKNRRRSRARSKLLAKPP